MLVLDEKACRFKEKQSLTSLCSDQAESSNLSSSCLLLQKGRESQLMFVRPWIETPVWLWEFT